MRDFGFLLTLTSEEGHPLFKEDMVAYFSLLFLLFFFFIQYNKYNTIIEHVSTPVPTMDNRQMCGVGSGCRLCIYNIQKGTDIETDIQRVGQSTSKAFQPR